MLILLLCGFTSHTGTSLYLNPPYILPALVLYFMIVFLIIDDCGPSHGCFGSFLWYISKPTWEDWLVFVSCLKYAHILSPWECCDTCEQEQAKNKKRKWVQGRSQKGTNNGKKGNLFLFKIYCITQYWLDGKMAKTHLLKMLCLEPWVNPLWRHPLFCHLPVLKPRNWLYGCCNIDFWDRKQCFLKPEVHILMRGWGGVRGGFDWGTEDILHAHLQTDTWLKTTNL